MSYTVKIEIIYHMPDIESGNTYLDMVEATFRRGIANLVEAAGGECNPPLYVTVFVGWSGSGRIT